MHRPQAVGLSAVMLSLLVIIAPSPASAAERPDGRGLVERGPVIRTPIRQVTADAYELARTAKQAIKAGTTDEACTGWRSTLFPPPTIRVLQTRGPNANEVYKDPLDPSKPWDIPFREYAEIVIGKEWGAGYGFEILKAAAIAVKQYAWYYTIVYRGGLDKHGNCFDVRDNTIDQWFEPGHDRTKAIHRRAFDATWTMHLRKTDRDTGRGRFILTGYRAGSTSAACGADSDGWRMYQNSMFECGRPVRNGGMGYNMEQAIREYLEKRLEIVMPGHNDVLGSADGYPRSLIGDVTAAIAGPKNVLEPHAWQVSSSGIAGVTGMLSDIGGGDLVGYGSADVTQDGWDDLIIARRTGDTSVRLEVAASLGTEYAAPVQWWSGNIGRDSDGGRVLAGDFNGDLRPDVALLVDGPKGSRELFMFASKAKRAQSGFKDPDADPSDGDTDPWWSGTMDAAASVHAGDVNGDGRDDLVVITDLGPEGRRYDVAHSAAPTDGLGALRKRFLATDIVGDVVRSVVADFTRDGRDDVLLVIDGPQRTRIEILHARKGFKAFARAEAWRSTTDGKLPFDKLKLGTSDLDNDGLTDLVMFRDRGASGTEILTFESAYKRPYGGLEPGPSMTDGSIDWNSLRPY